MDTIALGQGESVTVDMPMWWPSTRRWEADPQGHRRRSPDPESGEGFVFTGPGWILTQTRNPSAFEAWSRQLMPGQAGGAPGAIGGLLGR